MDYYNVEHPDYYESETAEECAECKREFLAADGAEFFCSVSGKESTFCCEQCMCDFFNPFFDEAGLYKNGIEDLVKDYEFKFSHPKIFDLEYENYYDNKINQMF